MARLLPSSRTAALLLSCCVLGALLAPRALGAGLTAQDLPLDTVLHVNPAAHTGVAARKQLYEVALNFVTLASVNVTAATAAGYFNLYVSKEADMSFRTSGDCVLDSVLTCSADLGRGSNYILIESTIPYTISTSSRPSTVIIALLAFAGALPLTAAVCGCIACKTCQRSADAPELLRVKSYLCYCVSLAVMLIAVSLLAVGGMVGGFSFNGAAMALPIAGAVALAVTLLYTGHSSVELNAKTKTCIVRKYWCCVCPRATVYPLSSIKEFYSMRITTSYTDGSATVRFRSFIRLTNGRKVALDPSRSSYGGFRSFVPRLNRFLVRADPDTPRGQGGAAGETLNPIVQAAERAVQLQVMQAQVLQQQQLLAQQQAALLAAQALAVQAQTPPAGAGQETPPPSHV